MLFMLYICRLRDVEKNVENDEVIQKELTTTTNLLISLRSSNYVAIGISNLYCLRGHRGCPIV